MRTAEIKRPSRPDFGATPAERGEFLLHELLVTLTPRARMVARRWCDATVKLRGHAPTEEQIIRKLVPVLANFLSVRSLLRWTGRGSFLSRAEILEGLRRLAREEATAALVECGEIERLARSDAA
jgi:hypothetical protein